MQLPKLRTLLWAWEGESFDDEETAGLRRVEAALEDASTGSLAGHLRKLLEADELDATRDRVRSLLAGGRFPGPNPEWPAIPWPPF